MDLAREAAAQARHHMQARPEDLPIPGSAAAALEDAEARARRRHPNYGLVVAQLSRSVRQCLALQAHLREGRAQPLTLPQPRHPAPHAAASQPGPPRAETLRLDAAERPDWALPAGPDGEIQVAHLLNIIRNDLGLAVTRPAPPYEPAEPPERTCNLAPPRSPDPPARPPARHDRRPQGPANAHPPPPPRELSG